jgi:hypothetical protein
MDTLRMHDFKNVPFMLYSLSNHLEKLCYTKIEGYDEESNVTLNSVKYSGGYLRKILKHILVCPRADGAKRRARVLIPPGYLHPGKRKH